MGGETRIDFVIQQIVDAIFNGAVVADIRQTRVRRANGELTAKLVGRVVHFCVVKKWDAALFEVSFKGGVFNHKIFLVMLAGTAVGNTGLGFGRARVTDKHTNTNAFAILLFKQTGEIVLRGFGNGDIQHIEVLK